MVQPNWQPRLEDVLKHKTEERELISKNGNDYVADVIPKILLLSTGSREDLPNNQYRYSIVDPKNNLEYSIKTENKVEVEFGKRLVFYELRGGTTQNGKGWYNADKVQVYKG